MMMPFHTDIYYTQQINDPMLLEYSVSYKVKKNRQKVLLLCSGWGRLKGVEENSIFLFRSNRSSKKTIFQKLKDQGAKANELKAS